MNPLAKIRDGHKLRWLFLAGLVVSAVAAFAIVRAVDGDDFVKAWDNAVADPASVGLALGAFALAFVLRAVAWQKVMPQLSFGHALAGIHAALGANHVLPMRLGEPLRIVSVVRRQQVPLESATASTVTLRGADMMAVVGLGLVVAPATAVRLLGWFGLLAALAVLLVLALAWRWLRRVATGRGDIVMPGPGVIGLVVAAWLAEAVLVSQAASWAGLSIGWDEAVLVTSIAVAAQIAAVAPGGFGTYEAAAVAAYVALGYDPQPALIAAVGAHGLKTAYSLIAGAIAVALPAPSLIGHLRLRPEPPRTTPSPVPTPTAAPIVLFMPAYNEEESVAPCVRRAPSMVGDHPVQVVVIDDGSTDATVERARATGAEVIQLHHNRGLGAAVRTGLALGAERNAAAVAFCDADGEYPPEELANLVQPILDGHADYVAGSRFLGRIDHMRPHRRFGNIVLTRVLSLVARRKISDGQTGYRAFSPAAASDAEVIHDFNYAQVLTLDLLAKGYRYHEVPISYHFRTAGDSFIKLGQYLRNVVPAIYRELNTP